MTRQPCALLIAATVVIWSTVIGQTGASHRQSSTPAVPQDFPEGTGREVVVRLCRECHPATDITRRRESRARWSKVVEEMIGQGARINDEDFEVLVSYLSVVLGRKVRINEASATVIAETFEISDEQAAAVVQYRTDRGPFKDWKGVAAVQGMDPQRVEEQRNNLDFTTGASGAVWDPRRSA